MGLQDSKSPISKRSGWKWLLAGVLLVLVVTLFPFNFTPIAIGKKDAVRSFFRHASDWFDFYANIALFFPYGFGLGQILQASRFKVWGRIFILILCCFSLTLTVEVLQLFLPDRSSSATDLFTNTLGGTLAGLYVLYHWSRLARSLGKLMRRLWATPWIVQILLGIWVSVMLWVPWQLQQGLHLQDWNPEFRLTIGNEYSGNRDWKGTVAGFSLSDRALNEQEVSDRLASAGFPSLPEAQMDYDLTPAKEQVPERKTGQLPLQSRQLPPEGVWIEPEDQARYRDRLRHPWFSQEEPARDVVNAIRQSHQFTFATRFTPDRLEQGGPAVIVTQSWDIYQCNFSLAQLDDRLLVMVRTPVTGYNGDHFILMRSQPLEKRSYKAVVTYRDGILRLYTQEDLQKDSQPTQARSSVSSAVNSVEKSVEKSVGNVVENAVETDELILKSEFTFFQYILPAGGHNLGLAEVNDRRFQSKLYPVLFYAIWSLPLGILMLRVFTLAKSASQPLSIPNAIALCLLAGVPTLGLSLVLQTIASPWSLQKWLISWGFALLPFLWNFLLLPLVLRSKRA